MRNLRSKLLATKDTSKLMLPCGTEVPKELKAIPRLWTALKKRLKKRGLL